MKHPFSIRHMQLLATVILALVILPTIEAEPRCPGNTASVTPRLVQHALLVIPVKINQAGPFDFIVDTGSQVTVIEPSLASELDLKTQGRVGLVSVANFTQASVTLLDTLEVGSRVVKKSPAVVRDLRSIQAADPRIRAVLGESFLAHFDLFVDYGHKLFCLDQTSAMRDSVRGQRIPFIRPQHPENELPFMERLVVSVRLSGTGEQPILLNPIVYPGSSQPSIQALGPGTLYTTIQRLLDLGLIEETESAGGQSDHENRRRYYKLTRTGKAVLAADLSRMESMLRLARDKKLVPKSSG